MKYFRCRYWVNNSHWSQGCIGVIFDNYRDLGGPVTFEFWFYFIGIEFEFGPKLNLDKDGNPV